jgi:hypothetical protein
VGAGAPRVEGKLLYSSYCPPDVCDMCAKIGMVSAAALRFGPEDLVETKLIIIVCKKTWAGLFKSFEKFKIASLEAELQLPKLQLKS